MARRGARNRPDRAHEGARRRRRRPAAGARDATRAVAGNARLLDGQDAHTGLRRRDGGGDAQVLHRLGERARLGARAPRSGARCTACCRRRRSRASAGSTSNRCRARPEPAPDLAFLARLFALLRAVDADWTAMSAGAAHVGRAGDPHQTLLDIVGLHPDSVEFHWRYSESLTELYNIVNLGGLGPAFWNALQSISLEQIAVGLLATPRLRRHAAGHPPARVPHRLGPDRARGRRPSVVGDRSDPRVHRRPQELHRVAHRGGKRVAGRGHAASTASPAT